MRPARPYCKSVLQHPFLVGFSSGQRAAADRKLLWPALFRSDSGLNIDRVGNRKSARRTELAETGNTWAEVLGKTAVVINGAPGFASSHLKVASALEATRMLEEGGQCSRYRQRHGIRRQALHRVFAHQRTSWAVTCNGAWSNIRRKRSVRGSPHPGSSKRWSAAGNWAENHQGVLQLGMSRRVHIRVTLGRLARRRVRGFLRERASGNYKVLNRKLQTRAMHPSKSTEVEPRSSCANYKSAPGQLQTGALVAVFFAGQDGVRCSENCPRMCALTAEESRPRAR